MAGIRKFLRGQHLGIAPAPAKGGGVEALHYASRRNTAQVQHDYRFGVSDKRTVKLFRLGRNQAVRIPRAFELPGDEAVVRKEGERLIIEPKKPRDSLMEVLDRLEPLDEPFPDIEDYPPEPFEL